MGWYYACLFTNDDQEQEKLENSFWELIGVFIDFPKMTSAEKEAAYREEYRNLLEEYGQEKDWEDWQKREQGEIPLGE